jgi:hypothetical protein
MAGGQGVKRGEEKPKGVVDELQQFYKDSTNESSNFKSHTLNSIYSIQDLMYVLPCPSQN